PLIASSRKKHPVFECESCGYSIEVPPSESQSAGNPRSKDASRPATSTALVSVKETDRDDDTKIRITCANCSRSLVIRDSDIGKIKKCPSCGAMFKVVQARDGTLAVMLILGRNEG